MATIFKLLIFIGFSLFVRKDYYELVTERDVLVALRRVGSSGLGLNPCLLHLAGGFSTTELPGKP